jgi:flavin reductase (DIM6/NTAB) family NADH-FMN oxidoreductase RutF
VGDEPRERQRAGSSDAITDRANYPLYVITTSVGDEVSGCLAGFVTQCSIEPLRFIVCISKVNYTFRVAERSKSLALHLLGSGQDDVASLFGEVSGNEADKFAQVRWSRGLTGAPILADCAAWAEGSIINRMSSGDHEAFLMTVSAGGRGDNKGRLMFRDAVELQAGQPA